MDGEIREINVKMDRIKLKWRDGEFFVSDRSPIVPVESGPFYLTISSIILKVDIRSGHLIVRQASAGAEDELAISTNDNKNNPSVSGVDELSLGTSKPKMETVEGLEEISLPNVAELKHDDDPGFSRPRLQMAKEFIETVTIGKGPSAKRMYKCTICDKRLTVLWNAQLHVRRIHFNERYKCEYCSKETYTYKQLSQHKIKDHGDKQSDPVEKRITKLPQYPIDVNSIKVRNPFPSFNLNKAVHCYVNLDRLVTVNDNLGNQSTINTLDDTKDDGAYDESVVIKIDPFDIVCPQLNLDDLNQDMEEQTVEQIVQYLPQKYVVCGQQPFHQQINTGYGSQPNG